MRRRRVLDVDLVAASVDVVRHSATGSFLVSHYHLPTGNTAKFMIQLVDPLSRFRVDVFPDLGGSIERATPYFLENQLTLLVSERDIFRHKLQTLQTASEARPVDPKHLDDAQTLSTSLGETLPDLGSLCLQPDQLGADVRQACPLCSESVSRAFPLAPKQQIFDLLGYV